MKQVFLSVLFLLVPVVASADDSGKCGENVTYNYSESTHTLIITGNGEMTYCDFNNTPWFNYHQKIVKVII